MKIASGAAAAALLSLSVLCMTTAEGHDNAGSHDYHDKLNGVPGSLNIEDGDGQSGPKVKNPGTRTGGVKDITGSNDPYVQEISEVRDGYYAMVSCVVVRCYCT